MRCLSQVAAGLYSGVLQFVLTVDNLLNKNDRSCGSTSFCFCCSHFCQTFASALVDSFKTFPVIFYVDKTCLMCPLKLMGTKNSWVCWTIWQSVSTYLQWLCSDHWYHDHKSCKDWLPYVECVQCKPAITCRIILYNHIHLCVDTSDIYICLNGHLTDPYKDWGP